MDQAEEGVVRSTQTLDTQQPRSAKVTKPTWWWWRGNALKDWGRRRCQLKQCSSEMVVVMMMVMVMLVVFATSRSLEQLDYRRVGELNC